MSEHVTEGIILMNQSLEQKYNRQVKNFTRESYIHIFSEDQDARERIYRKSFKWKPYATNHTRAHSQEIDWPRCDSLKALLCVPLNCAIALCTSSRLSVFLIAAAAVIVIVCVVRFVGTIFVVSFHGVSHQTFVSTVPAEHTSKEIGVVVQRGRRSFRSKVGVQDGQDAGLDDGHGRSRRVAVSTGAAHGHQAGPRLLSPPDQLLQPLRAHEQLVWRGQVEGRALQRAQTAQPPDGTLRPFNGYRRAAQRGRRASRNRGGNPEDYGQRPNRVGAVPLRAETI